MFTILFVLMVGNSSVSLARDEESLGESYMASTLVELIQDKNIILSTPELTKLVTQIRSVSDAQMAKDQLQLLSTIYQERINRLEEGLVFLNSELSHINEDVSNQAVHNKVSVSIDSPVSDDSFQGFLDIELLGIEKAQQKIKDYLRIRSDKARENFINEFLRNVSQKHDVLLKFYASVFLDKNDSISRNYGHAARIHLKRAELGIENAKEDFYRILENFKELYVNYASCESQNLYPICLEEIGKGDQKTKELLEENYILFGFLTGIFEYYVKKGDEESIQTAWNLYQQNKKIIRNQKTYILNHYWAAIPIINFYKKKADIGDLAACQRITEMALPEETHMVSFRVGTEYYAKAMDLGDSSARSGLLNALKRLRTSNYEGVGLNATYLKWVESQDDLEILKATADALLKTDQISDYCKDPEAAAKIYHQIQRLEPDTHA